MKEIREKPLQNINSTICIPLDQLIGDEGNLAKILGDGLCGSILIEIQENIFTVLALKPFATRN